MQAKELLHQLIEAMSDQEAATLLRLLVLEREGSDPRGKDLAEALAAIRAMAERLEAED